MVGTVMAEITNTTQTTWLLNETLSPFNYEYDNEYYGAYHLEFMSNGTIWHSMSHNANRSDYPGVAEDTPYGNLIYTNTALELDCSVYEFHNDTWISEEYRTITILGGTEASDWSFINWLTNNATQLEYTEPIKPAAVVVYDDEIITTLQYGQIASLNCADSKMKSDIVIQIAKSAEITPSAPVILQEKTVVENGVVMPDEGYTGLAKVTVEVPLPPTYWGEGYDL